MEVLRSQNQTIKAEMAHNRIRLIIELAGQAKANMQYIASLAASTNETPEQNKQEPQEIALEVMENQ